MSLRKLRVGMYAPNHSAISGHFWIIEFYNAQHDLKPFKRTCASSYRAALSRAQSLAFVDPVGYRLRFLASLSGHASESYGTAARVSPSKAVGFDDPRSAISVVRRSTVKAGRRLRFRVAPSLRLDYFDHRLTNRPWRKDSATL